MSSPRASRVRAYIACSLDGFIAGLDDDLSWLSGSDSETNEESQPETEAITFEGFMAEIGAMLMGRRTYDTVAGFDVPWPYGETPVLVMTHRSLEQAPATVSTVAGSIEDVIEAAKAAAGERDVYLDGGQLIRQTLDASLLDELVITIVPIALGAGIPLFTGLTRRHSFEFVAMHRYGQFLQYVARPRPIAAKS